LQVALNWCKKLQIIASGSKLVQEASNNCK
jgi:hypothetical protein